MKCFFDVYCIIMSAYVCVYVWVCVCVCVSVCVCVCVCMCACVMSGSLTHSGLVESSAEAQWELLSLVDNTQRGSQKRMIEKLRHTAESYYQQSTGESETIL